MSAVLSMQVLGHTELRSFVWAWALARMRGPPCGLSSLICGLTILLQHCTCSRNVPVHNGDVFLDDECVNVKREGGICRHQQGRVGIANRGVAVAGAAPAESGCGVSQGGLSVGLLVLFERGVSVGV